MAQQVIAWTLAGFFWLVGVVVLAKSKWNTGSLMIWLLAVVFSLWGLFPVQVAALAASCLGYWLWRLFWAGLLALAALILFLAIAGKKCSLQGNEAAIIVLGAGLQRTVVSDVLERRLLASYRAFAENPAALVVVSGGQGRGEDIPEAVAMQRWLEERGVPLKQIVVEGKSTSTETNLQYSKTLLQARGISPTLPVAVVTNTFHCYRARCYARGAGFAQVRSLPASMSRSTYLQNYLREALAVLFMWLFRRPHKTAPGQPGEKG